MLARMGQGEFTSKAVDERARAQTQDRSETTKTACAVKHTHSCTLIHCNRYIGDPKPASERTEKGKAVEHRAQETITRKL